MSSSKKYIVHNYDLGADFYQENLLVPNGFCMENFPLILVRARTQYNLTYKVFDMKLGKHLEHFPAEFSKYSFIGSLDSVEEDS